MLAKRQTTTGNPKANKYGHSSIFISPVVTQVPPWLHFLQREVRVSCSYISGTQLQIFNVCWQQNWRLRTAWHVHPAKNCQLSLSGFPIKIAHRETRKKQNKLQLLTD